MNAEISEPDTTQRNAAIDAHHAWADKVAALQDEFKALPYTQIRMADPFFEKGHTSERSVAEYKDEISLFIRRREAYQSAKGKMNEEEWSAIRHQFDPRRPGPSLGGVFE